MTSMNKKLTYTGLMTALVLLFTFVVKVPTFKGYIHLGDGMVLLSGFLLGPAYGAFAAGVGSALSDIIGGYSNWALPTLVIKATMAAIVGYFAIKKDNRKVIFIGSSVFSIVWIAFSFILRNILTTHVGESSSDIAQTMEISLTDLLNLSTNTQNVLLIVALILPFLFAVILFMLRNKGIKFPLAFSTSFIIAGALMIVLYYISESIIYGSYVISIFSIPTNLIQFTAGMVIAHGLLPIVSKLKINMQI